MINSNSFTGPDPPEWRMLESVAYLKNKLYHLGGYDSKIYQSAHRVDVRRSNESP